MCGEKGAFIRRGVRAHLGRSSFAAAAAAAAAEVKSAKSRRADDVEKEAEVLEQGMKGAAIGD